MRRTGIQGVGVGFLLALAVLCGCQSFGAGNATQPGSTPNVGAQTSFRMLGTIGTPFVATISDQRSSWVLRGTVPLNVIIANGNFPVRIVANKLVNSNAMLSVEIIHGFGVGSLSSTFTNYGIAVGSLFGTLRAFAPPASPNAAFFVNGPAGGVFNATVEDSTTAFIFQSRVPCVIFYDSPDNNSLNAHVDGIFNLVNGDVGPLTINLVFDGNIKFASGSGTVTIHVN
jgi:hypothetical protein